MISSSFFTKTVTLQRPTVTKDKAGGAKRDFENVSGMVSIPAAVQPLSSTDINLFAGRQIQVSHAIYVERDIGYQRGDRLIVNDGRIFSIRGTLDFAGAGRIFKLVCREIKS